ncbi:MAG: hypothetical protein IJQ40_01060, partial [Bacilli bacterium]|nr:hypothetical protein [Bacilli bacterium]
CACTPDNYSAEGSKSKLSSNGYTVEVYSSEEAKSRIKGLDYSVAEFTNALYAEKGADENKDLFLAFYFKSISDCDKFVDANIVLMNDYGSANLGENLTKKVGSHNNVAYVGSETSFDAAF